MSERWSLSRAGIVNVYQYGDETLTFGGGRLLLRGVNGSGKSTAMNMLLPFLLDADTRRIDAAGEQSGVLKSWMLNGRTEQQPIGYLWLEVSRGTEHLVFGCGIKANRSTDTVKTWWFVTTRRPGVDLNLVEGRTPLSSDALRSELGDHAVFKEKDRARYRVELRRRLYGGAELDQHIRLLHIVRNPRVGDRIDVDLPNYLTDALPQLSETALDDAAQPLEDLDEHRRSVESLTSTHQSLRGLLDVYTTYARTELRGRASHASHLVRAHAKAERDRNKAGAALEAARHRLADAEASRKGLEGDVERLRGEIAALKDSDAYRSGMDLADLRTLVQNLADTVATETQLLHEADARTTSGRAELGGLTSMIDDFHSRLDTSLQELGALAERWRLGVAPPAVSLALDAGIPSEAGGAFDVDGFVQSLGNIRAASRRRQGDADEVAGLLQAHAERASAVVAREADVKSAERHLRLAGEADEQTRHALLEAATRWCEEIGRWNMRLADHCSTHGVPEVAVPQATAAEVTSNAHLVRRRFEDGARRAIDHHAELCVTAAEAVSAARSDVETCQAEVDRLDDLELPDPPSLTWQATRKSPSLAELVDFRDDLGPQDRAWLEAALEASGILTAEVAADGSLTLATGDLVAIGGPAAGHPLSELLVVRESGDESDGATANCAVARSVLDHISTDPADLKAKGVGTVVTVNGQFRVGSLVGRHAKERAEHIGIAARRAALEAARAEALVDLTDAQQSHTELVEAHHLHEQNREEAKLLLAEVPEDTAVSAARRGADRAQAALVTAQDHLTGQTESLRRAEQSLADAIEAIERQSATLGTPKDQTGLEAMRGDLVEVRSIADTADGHAKEIGRLVQTRSAKTAALQTLVDQEKAASERLEESRSKHQVQSSRLITLEDSIGQAFDEVQATIERTEHELAVAAEDLEKARALESELTKKHTEADVLAQTTATEADAKASSCIAERPKLSDALLVPGLTAAATATHAPADASTDATSGTDAEPWPVVDSSPAGVAALAAAILERVPDPATAGSAESVRQSIRRRRDQLGAGWDAEDHQPDPALPIRIEVTGPEGQMPLPDAASQVAIRLRQTESLLSTKQDQALRNLLQGLIAKEAAEKLHAAQELIDLINARLSSISTSQGIKVSVRWKRRDDLEAGLTETIGLLAKPPGLRTAEEDQQLATALSERIQQARQEDPEAPYRDLIATVLDYRQWHRLTLVLHRPGQPNETLGRRSRLSEGEKKMISYLPMFAAVAASCDALAEAEPTAPRFLLLDDAFAKVSEDNHAKLFGLLVELDLDFIATSERLWGTHDTVPELAITEVIRDADLGVIVLEHARWDGNSQTVDAR